MSPVPTDGTRFSLSTDCMRISGGAGLGKDQERKQLGKLANDRGPKKEDTIFFFIYNFVRISFVLEAFLIIILTLPDLRP